MFDTYAIGIEDDGSARHAIKGKGLIKVVAWCEERGVGGLMGDVDEWWTEIGFLSLI